MQHVSIPRLELQAAVMAVRPKEQKMRNTKRRFTVLTFGQTQLLFCNEFTPPTVGNKLYEILDTTNVSQRNHVSGINNPADIGTQAIKVDDLKGSERLTGLA